MVRSVSKLWPMPSLLRFAKLRWKRGKITASIAEPPPPPVDPPEPGYLPFSDIPLSPGENSYQVYFFLDGSYSGYEGALMMDNQTVLTSGVAADAISNTPGTWIAKMGGVLSSGADADQSIAATGPIILDPSFGGYGDYATDLGVVFCGGPFITNSLVAPIEYSAAVDSVPYSGEYFYPVNTVVAMNGMIEWSGGAPSVSDAVGSLNPIITNLDAGAALAESIPDAAICTSDVGLYYAGYGAPLICAGYGTYFTIGHLVRQDTGNQGALVFNRYSHKTGTIESISGIGPLVYP